METNRKIKILTILGFNESFVLEKFLENIIYNVDKTDLHEKGIAMIEIKEILRKVNPQHEIFERESIIKEDAEQEGIDMAQYFVPSVEQ